MESSKQLDSDVISQISGYLRVGADFFLATAACGVKELTAKEWLSKAEAAGACGEESIYGDLYHTIRTSKAQAEVIALQRLSAEGGANGARWLLEKMAPEKYKSAANPKKEKPQTGGSPFDVDLSKL